MKHPLFKSLVVLFSVSAVAAYVWHASQKRSTEQTPVVTTAVEGEQKDSSPAIAVEDEEIRIKKEAMLSTSKSGIIMKDGDIRKMLEGQKAAESISKPPNTVLMRSSKSFSGNIIPPSDLKNLIEGERNRIPIPSEQIPNNPSPRDLAPSSK